jgi:hypothetical protein
MPISTIDFVTPYDPTGYPSVNGAQLLQLVSGLLPYTGIGFSIVTTDSELNTPQVPNANITPKWKNYIWVRITSTAVIPYIWSPYAADGTYYGWVSLAASAIGAGTVTGFNIAYNTITDVNISDVNWSKISGAPTSLPPSGAASGALTGIYPNPSIGNAVVTGSMIAAATITGSNINSATIAGTQLINNTIGTAQMGAQSVDITTALKVGTPLWIPRTNAGATACEWINPQGNSAVGRILQYTKASQAGKVSAAGNFVNTTTNPVTGAIGVTASGLSITLTPKASGSLLCIKAHLLLSASGSVGAFAAIYDVSPTSGASHIPIGLAGIYGGSGAGTAVTQVTVVGYVTSVDNITPVTYYLGFGGTAAASVAIGSTDGTNNFFGAGSVSVIEVTEYL